MKALFFSLLVSASACFAESFVVVRASSGEVPVGTTLQWITQDCYTNGQYSARMFTKVDRVITNSAGELVVEQITRCVFWDKTEPYVWDWFCGSNRYDSAKGFVVLDFLNTLP